MTEENQSHDKSIKENDQNKESSGNTNEDHTFLTSQKKAKINSKSSKNTKNSPLKKSNHTTPQQGMVLYISINNNIFLFVYKFFQKAFLY